MYLFGKTLKRRPRRNRTLKTEDWGKLRDLVTQRDVKVVQEWAKDRAVTLPYPGNLKAVGDRLTLELCPAVVMDPSLLGTCSGPWRLDHVREEPMIGKKAPDDEDHLVSLCAAHDERGAIAGRVWNTAHRAEERAYLDQRRMERLAGAGSG